MDEGFFGPPQSKPLKSKLILIISALILVVAGFLIWHFWTKNTVKADTVTAIVNSPNRNDVSDWEVYNNIKYNYSIKYENSWFVYDKDPTVVQIEPYNNVTAINSGLTIKIKENVGNQSIDDLIGSIYPKIQYQKTPIVISGINGFSVKTVCSTGCGLAERFVIYDNNLYHLKQNPNLSLVSFNEMVGTFSFGQSAAAAVSSVSSQTKVYLSKDLGFEFNYPGSWKDIILNQIDQNSLNKGSGFSSLYQAGSVEPVYFDPDNMLSFNVYSSDFNNGTLTLPVAQKVDSNWTQDDFIKNTKPQDWITGYKKLGNNALLVLTHADHACFPDFKINIYVPTTNKIYPNLIINLDTTDVDKDQIISDYLHIQGAQNLSICDTTVPYEELSTKILNNTYSGKMTAAINAATQIANSFKNL